MLTSKYESARQIDGPTNGQCKGYRRCSSEVGKLGGPAELLTFLARWHRNTGWSPSIHRIGARAQRVTSARGVTKTHSIFISMCFHNRFRNTAIEYNTKFRVISPVKLKLHCKGENILQSPLTFNNHFYKFNF